LEILVIESCTSKGKKRKRIVMEQKAKVEPILSYEADNPSFKDKFPNQNRQALVDKHCKTLLAQDRDGSLKNPDIHQLHKDAWNLGTGLTGVSASEFAAQFDQIFEKAIRSALETVFKTTELLVIDVYQ